MMKTETKVLIGIFAATVLLLLGGVFLLSKNQPSQESTLAEEVKQIDYTKGYKIGSDSAKVKLVEFSDLQCPACRSAESAVQSIINEHRDNPDFQFVYRHFPLPIHKNARSAANAVEEAGAQGNFWAMKEKIFETQTEWENMGNVNDYFSNLSSELGLDGAKVKDAIEKKKYEDKIQADVDEGYSLNVNSTPTFFLNGKKVSVTNFEQLKEEVTKALQTN